MQDALVFDAVIETGSFSEAARLLGITPSTISKRIARLEQALGTELLHRSTRGMAPTEDGLIYHRYVRDAIDLVTQGEREVRHRKNEMNGRLMIVAGQAFTTHVLCHAIRHFHVQHPQVQLSITVHSEPISQMYKGHDLCFQWGSIKDCQFVSRKIMEDEIVYICSPDFFAREKLDRHNAPELMRHFIDPPAPLGVDSARYLYSHDTSQSSVLVNDIEVITQLAVLGVGITKLPRFVAQPYIASGQLMEIADVFAPLQISGYALSHQRPSENIKIHTFLRHVDEQISGIQHLQGKC